MDQQPSSISEAAPIFVPLDQLHDSPFNARRKYANIEELAANIKAEGRIHQALLARPVPGGSGFELVFGHRRKRGALMAGLTVAPVVVRDMSDAQVRSAQAAENLQRDDITPLEEAQSYADMVAHDGLSVDQVATRVSRSRAHVYGRLQLLRATPTVRIALEDGTVDASVALLLARLRTEKLQEKALTAIKGKGLSLQDGGKSSFRRIQELLAEEFTLRLREALFDPEDATLVESAGVCSACPKRTGNAPEYADLAQPDDERTRYGFARRSGPDLCTDPDCWGEKKAAHLRREAAALQRTGTVVVTGNAARSAISARGEVKGAYVALADVKAHIKGTKVATVAIQDPRTGKVFKAVKRADLPQQGDLLEDQAGSGRAGRQAHQASQEAIESARSLERSRRDRLRTEIRGRMRTAASRSVDELRLITCLLLDTIGYHVELRVLEANGLDRNAWLGDRLKGLSGAQLAQLLLDCVLESCSAMTSWQDLDEGKEEIEEMCAIYDIDPTREGLSTPSTAGASAESDGAARASAPMADEVGA